MKDEKTQWGTLDRPIDLLDLVTHIPVGVCKFLLNDDFTLVYGNQMLYSLCGYTQAQFQQELSNGIVHTFFKDERCATVQRLLRDYEAGLSGFRVENRLTRRSGEIIWVLASGSFTTHNGAPAAHGILVDITEQKQIEERLRVNEQRFRLALAQTDSTIFDYDIATKVMIHADKSAEKYGLSYETPNVPECLAENGVVHPDCAQDFLEMYRRIRAGEPTASCVIRARTGGDRYVWQKITLTTIYDQDGTAVRAVGILEDIDEQTRREARLLEQSQCDPLTGLYNKRVTESRIQHLLQEDASSGALFIVDLDSFKDVNDQYGHQFGDMVLLESARRLARLFRKRDVVGRIGGDEFFIYLDGTDEKENVIRKAHEVCEVFSKPFLYNGISKLVTCTVGIARCPADGVSFETLYQKADIALYKAKRNGKNQICLCGVSAD